MVLSKVTTRWKKFKPAQTGNNHTYTRRRPLRVTCPAIGSNSPVNTLILKDHECNFFKIQIDSVGAYSVDFPAPFAPTIAILDSSPTSKFTFFKMILSGEYPKVTSFACRSGGDILSVSGNLER
jgi:hypothetical protein